MDLSDRTLLALTRWRPTSIPIGHIHRAMIITEGDDREKLVASISKRKPADERERSLLIWLALRYKVGGVMFLDSLGAFNAKRPN